MSCGYCNLPLSSARSHARLCSNLQYNVVNNAAVVSALVINFFYVLARLRLFYVLARCLLACHSGAFVWDSLLHKGGLGVRGLGYYAIFFMGLTMECMFHLKVIHEKKMHRCNRKRWIGAISQATSTRTLRTSTALWPQVTMCKLARPMCTLRL